MGKIDTTGYKTVKVSTNKYCKVRETRGMLILIIKICEERNSKHVPIISTGPVFNSLDLIHMVKNVKTIYDLYKIPSKKLFKQNFLYTQT